MDDQCSYEFSRLAAMDGQFPFELKGFGAMDCNCTYEIIGFGGMTIVLMNSLGLGHGWPVPI